MGMTGGAGVTYVYRVKADHTGIVQSDGTTAATTLAHAMLKVGRGYAKKNILVQTDYTYNDDNTLNIKWTQTGNEADLQALLDVACPRKLGAASTGVQELIDENGYKIGGDSGSSSDANFLIISYGAKDADGKIPVVMSIGTFLKTSGSYSMSNNNWNQPTLEFKSVSCLNASGLALAKELFDGTIVNNTGAPSWDAAAATIGYQFYSKSARITATA